MSMAGNVQSGTSLKDFLINRYTDSTGQETYVLHFHYATEIKDHTGVFM